MMYSLYKLKHTFPYSNFFGQHSTFWKKNKNKINLIILVSDKFVNKSEDVRIYPLQSKINYHFLLIFCFNNLRSLIFEVLILNSPKNFKTFYTFCKRLVKVNDFSQIAYRKIIGGKKQQQKTLVVYIDETSLSRDKKCEQIFATYFHIYFIFTVQFNCTKFLELLMFDLSV